MGVETSWKYSFKQAVDVLLRVEDDEVVNLLAYSSVSNRKTQLLRDGDGDAALGRAVEFGEHDACDARDSEKLSRLLQTVLARDGVNDEKRFMRSALDLARGDALHLLKLGHQVRFVVKSPCGVNDEHVGAARLRRSKGVEEDSRGVCALLLLYERDAGALGPDGELVGGGGAEGVGGADENVVALGLDALRELADGRGLADAVDADDHDDVRQNRDGHALFGGDALLLGLVEYGEQLVLYRALQRGDVAYLLARDSAPNLVEYVGRRLHADVGGDERLFQFVEKLRVNDLATLKDRVNLLGQRLARGGDCAREARGVTLFERFDLGLKLLHRAVESEYRRRERLARLRGCACGLRRRLRRGLRCGLRRARLLAHFGARA